MELPGSSSFSFRDLFKNRKFILTGILLVLLIGYGAWAHYGFSLEIFRFFADDCTERGTDGDDCTPGDGGAGGGGGDAQELEPPAFNIESGPGPYNHGDEVTVAWSATTSQGCTSRNEFFSTDGQKEGRKTFNVSACNGRNHSVGVECTYPEGTTVRDRSFTINTDTCPDNPPPKQCSDVEDNDGDGKTDLADPGCTGPNDNSEDTDNPGESEPPPAGCNSTNVVKNGAWNVLPNDSDPTTVRGHVKNNSGSSCKVIVAAYKIFTGGSQERYEYTSLIVSAGESGSITTSLPDCYTQSDMVVGNPNEADDLIAPPTPNFLPSNFITAKWTREGQICGAAASPTPSVSPSTSPSPTVAALVCTPATQTVTVGAEATLQAAGGTGNYSWAATGGTPATGGGATYKPTFADPGPHNVRVTSGTQQYTCVVQVVSVAAALICSPASQTVLVNQSANFSASGGSSTSYAWSAPGGSTSSGNGTAFNTQFSSAGSYSVTVTNGSEQKTCAVTVSPTLTPTPTPNVTMSIAKTVRNTTANGNEADVVSANPTDTVEFIIRVSASGNTTARNVRLIDILPQGLTYISGSTTIDGVTAVEGLLSGGLYLGDITAGRTIIVRFRATLASAGTFSVGTSTLTNTVNATSDNSPPVSDPAFVNVTRVAEVAQLFLQKLGRNVTRGELAEQNRVVGYPNDTIEFIIRVRSLSSTTASSVIVSDVLPSYITVVPNTTSIDGTLSGGNILSGIDVGPLAPSQEKIIRFSGRLASATALPTGTTSLINTAQVATPSLIAQLPIVVANGIIKGATQVPTGSEGSILTALLISLIVTLMYVAYTRTQLFKTRELESVIKKTKKHEDFFDFKK